jgi:hypothetical protein
MIALSLHRNVQQQLAYLRMSGLRVHLVLVGTYRAQVIVRDFFQEGSSFSHGLVEIRMRKMEDDLLLK